MAEQSEQPIIIKRIKKGGHGGHHGGAWKVAFADFMTAMMAFFMVMWLVGQKPEVRESVAGFFREPGKFDSKGSSGILKGSRGIVPNVQTSIGRPNKEAESKKGVSAKEMSAMTQAGQSLLIALEKQKAFKRLKKNIKIQMTSEGLRVILNESENSPAFFEPGSAKLLQKSAVILMTIAKELGNLDNRIVIEGHTDASFAGNKAYTNWELSADRANAARQLLEVSGLRENQVREVRGFADQFPMIIDRPNDARNRRISLVVLYQAREGTYDQIEVGDDLVSASAQG